MKVTSALFLIFGCKFRKGFFYKLNPLLCKGVATLVDPVITYLFLRKVFIKEVLYQCITAMAASLPASEVASSILCCILKTIQGFYPSFEYGLLNSLSVSWLVCSMRLFYFPTLYSNK